MLTLDEKHSLSDQEGPLNGTPLFASVFQNAPDLSAAFVQFCRLHRPAIFIDWIRSSNPDVVSLERETADFGETIDAFLDWLPEDKGLSAAHALKEALGTENIPLNVSPTKTQLPRNNVRTVQDLIDRMWRGQAAQSISKDDLESLYNALQAFGEPPVDVRQFEALMEKIEGFRKQDSITAKDLHPVLYYLRFNFPHHEPLLKDFVRWVDEPNRPQHEICDVTLTDWLELLKTMEPADRETAAQAIERVVTAPEHAASCETLTSELRH